VRTTDPHGFNDVHSFGNVVVKPLAEVEPSVYQPNGKLVVVGTIEESEFDDDWGTDKIVSSVDNATFFYKTF